MVEQIHLTKKCSAQAQVFSTSKTATPLTSRSLQSLGCATQHRPPAQSTVTSNCRSEPGFLEVRILRPNHSGNCVFWVSSPGAFWPRRLACVIIPLKDIRPGPSLHPFNSPGWLAGCWLAAGWWLVGWLAGWLLAGQQDSCHGIPAMRRVPQNTKNKIRATAHQQ